MYTVDSNYYSSYLHLSTYTSTTYIYSRYKDDLWPCIVDINKTCGYTVDINTTLCVQPSTTKGTSCRPGLS